MTFTTADRWMRKIFDKRSGPGLYALKTTAFSLAIVFLVLLLASASGLAHPPDVLPESIVVELIAALVVAPVLENLLMILVIHFLLAFKLRTSAIVPCVALLSGVLHWLAVDWRAVAGLVIFGVMTYSYLAWSEQPFRRRYGITVAQHALFNLPAALALIAEAMI